MWPAHKGGQIYSDSEKFQTLVLWIFSIFVHGEKGEKGVMLFHLKESWLGLQLLFLVGHLAQLRANFFFFPLQITNNVVLDLWVVCIKMFLNLNLTWRCQSCMHSDLKTLPRQASTLFQSSGPKVLVWLGACTGDALTRYRNVVFFFYLDCFWRWPRSPTSVCQAALLSRGASAVTWRLIQLQLRHTVFFF